MTKTAIVTGGSQGIGAAIVHAFLEKGYNVVATSRNVTKSRELKPSDRLALVDGDIGDAKVAAEIVEAAVSKFGGVDALVNNAGIFVGKPFTDYTAEDFKSLSATNLEGFLYVTQLAVKQMMVQKRGGSVVGITTAMVENPVAQVPASVAMITKGGIAATLNSLAMEYAKENIRFNAVGPGLVDTPLTEGYPVDFMETLSPMGTISEGKDIADAVLYLTEARHVTGETIHVDGGMHIGRW